MAIRVGLAANPVAGTDVRRIYSTAGFMDNMQKARILLGVLKGLEASGVDEVLAMPDFYGIAAYSLSKYSKLGGSLAVGFLDMEPEGSPRDTVEAVRLMVREGVGAIVLLGGDGTVRLAAKTSGGTPLMPVSSGTNNVIPYLVDGTLAGLAAGAVARGCVDSRALVRMKRVKIYVDGIYADHALVDAAGTLYPFKASRAVVDVGKVTEMVVSYAPVGSIGLASIASSIRPVGARDPHGLYLGLGRDGRRVRAVLAPGVVESVWVREYRLLGVGERVEIRGALTVELDGERELMVGRGSFVEAELDFGGPVIIDLEEALKALSGLGEASGRAPGCREAHIGY